MKTNIKLALFATVVILITGVLYFHPFFNQVSFEQQVYDSLVYRKDFGDHPWYVAPMKGKTVLWLNNTELNESVVISDYWDSCEHNPDQKHLIAIDYVNKTLYQERVLLDVDVGTRNYTATMETLVWINASCVRGIKFGS